MSAFPLPFLGSKFSTATIHMYTNHVVMYTCTFTLSNNLELTNFIS